MFSQVAHFPAVAGGIYVPQPVLIGAHPGASPFQLFGPQHGPPIAVTTVPLSPCSVPLSPVSPGGASMPIVPSMNRPHAPPSQTVAGEGPTQLRKLFIGGLNHETTDEQLRSYYSRWGQVVDCIVIRDPQTKHSRGFGFVTYSAIHMAEAAMADRPHTINSKVVDPKRAIPREEMSPFFASNPPHFLETDPDPTRKVDLTGVHWDYHTVDTLRDYFAKFGPISQVEILGHPRGSGFVVFDEKGAVERCLSCKQHTINGRKCDVSKPSDGSSQAEPTAKPTSDSKSSTTGKSTDGSSTTTTTTTTTGSRASPKKTEANHNNNNSNSSNNNVKSDK